MSEKELLKVEHLSVSLNGEKILHDLTFNVKEGEVLIILGPNGAGKTTLLRTLLGLVPYEGNIAWGTQKLSYLPPQELLVRKDLPPLSVQDFFNFKNVSQQKITEYLNFVGLDSALLKKQFNVLSTGQFQRMIIAWALIDEPSVLLFDEPTSGIDIGGEETIYSLLHKFWKEKKLTVLLVTHDLNIVWEHANNVLCLNKKKVCYGRPADVLSPESLSKLYRSKVKFYKHEHEYD
jgi:zinc transport system ATP-binding protein